LFRKLLAMSMNISAFAQLQNWFAGQASLNQQIFGNSNAAPTTNFSAAFANAANNFYSQKGSLAVTALQLRQVQSAQAAQKTAAGKTGVDPALAAARAAGNDILTNLGLISSPPKTTPSSSSGPYAPPINGATGYAYVPTSAAAVSDLGAVNILA
jgi:hypothetical protein